MIFDQIYLKYEPKIRDYLRGKYRDDIADDLCAEILIKVYKGFSSFDGDKAKIETWVYTVANNHVIDYERRKEPKFICIDELIYLEDKQEEQIDISKLGILIKNAYSHLNANQLEITQMFFNENMKMSDIAALLDIPLNTVKTHIIRSRAILKKQLYDVHSKCKMQCTYLD